MGSMSLGITAPSLIGLMIILMIPFSQQYTYELDVSAINILYTALGSPPLPGWMPIGGDPCVDRWQGVLCVNANITGITLNAANLGGALGDGLGKFSSIITINLSNNHIGGNIPESLPRTLQQLFLSDNQFIGSIPSSLSDLTLLSAMSLNGNLLTGELPDSFQLLTSLTNLDISSNNLTGQLPPSMGSLSSLTTLHIQSNQLSGTLDVLQDLPLQDLNIENNLFSGPVPPKLLNIPNFKKDGNPFNTTIAPSSSLPPSPLSGSPSPSGAPRTSGNVPDGSSSQDNAPSERKAKKSSTKIILIAFSVVVGLIFLILIAILLVRCCASKLQEMDNDHEKVSSRVDTGPYGRPGIDTRINSNLAIPNHEVLPDTKIKVPEVPAEKPMEDEIDSVGVVDSMGVVLSPPSPVDKVIVNLIAAQETETKMPSPGNLELNPPPKPPTSAVSFSVASLQQYTNSFSEENLIRDGRLGKVYQADLPDGKQLTVMKLDNVNSKIPEDIFLELVLSISELRHPNILELVGYCSEYEQRLLVYNSFSKRALHDVLHGGDDTRRKLSWNARVQLALGAGKALEYLHEGCDPPIIHQNFESANVLLDDELAVRVCDCGLASMLSNISPAQLSGRIRSLFSYEAPEVGEFGKYTEHSDVYSFGVVMLELLTGREPFDSTRPRAEQYLVRWARSQLHDINNLSRMVDPAIEGKCPVKSLSRFADIISRCIQQAPEFRPPMSEVVQDLTLMVEEINQRREGNSTST